MNPPEGSTTYEGELAVFWFNEHGILCARAKNTPRSMERQKANYEFIRKISGNKKVCLLSDTSTTAPQDKETRDYAAKEMPNVFSAMAVISGTAMGKFIANQFIHIKDHPIPIQLFEKEEDAVKWLKQYS
jgi:hypothetical protein